MSTALKYALPTMIGYIPVGITFGVIATESGLPPLASIAMSLFVFAGSSQFIGVAQMALALNPISIIASVGMTNFRYFLLSMTMSQKIKKAPLWYKLLFSWQMSDETFAINASRYEARFDDEESWYDSQFMRETITINTFSQLAWVAGTAMGAFFGEFLGDTSRFGFDFVLVGLFIALLAPQLKNHKLILVALCSGLLATVLTLIGFKEWSVIIAAITGCTLGACLK